MTRLLLAAALLAAVAWLLRRPAPAPDPAWDEDEDGVQPADPVTLYGGLTWEATSPFYYGKVHFTPSAFDSRLPMDTIGSGYGTTTAPDPTYLEAREVAIRSAQAGPLGPAA